MATDVTLVQLFDPHDAGNALALAFVTIGVVAAAVGALGCSARRWAANEAAERLS